MWMTLRGLQISTVITTAPRARETSEAAPAPATPPTKPVDQHGVAADIDQVHHQAGFSMDTLLLPMARNSAAPALYSARKG